MLDENMLKSMTIDQRGTYIDHLLKVDKALEQYLYAQADLAELYRRLNNCNQYVSECKTQYSNALDEKAVFEGQIREAAKNATE